jgi:hypothetical protein
VRRSVVAWLEVPVAGGWFTVLPQAAGLVSSGAPGSAGCPQGAAGGCGFDVGDTVGNVSLPQGQGQTVAAGESLELDFRYFPELDAADRTLLSGSADVTLAVAVTESSGSVAIIRQAVGFGAGPAAAAVTVEGVLPSGTSSIQVASISSGAQLESTGQFRYGTSNETRHQFDALFTASAANASSGSAQVTVGVEPDRSGLSAVEARSAPGAQLSEWRRVSSCPPPRPAT